ncbi:MAG: hypothetical protein J3R72DRAFT_452129 [Linnemannia gamsii]|nr:MAG: hypothetical protein J3R72DRAFT_452129 [Linnemannia gamsii]
MAMPNAMPCHAPPWVCLFFPLSCLLFPFSPFLVVECCNNMVVVVVVDGFFSQIQLRCNLLSIIFFAPFFDHHLDFLFLRWFGR